MTKLWAVLISSPRLFQIRNSLKFIEAVLSLCDLAGESSQSRLVLELYYIANNSLLYKTFLLLDVSAFCFSSSQLRKKFLISSGLQIDH